MLVDRMKERAKERRERGQMEIDACIDFLVFFIFFN